MNQGYNWFLQHSVFNDLSQILERMSYGQHVCVGLLSLVALIAVKNGRGFPAICLSPTVCRFALAFAVSNAGYVAAPWISAGCSSLAELIETHRPLLLATDFLGSVVKALLFVVWVILCLIGFFALLGILCGILYCVFWFWPMRVARCVGRAVKATLTLIGQLFGKRACVG